MIKTGSVESLFGGKREKIHMTLFDHQLILCKLVRIFKFIWNCFTIQSHYVFKALYCYNSLENKIAGPGVAFQLFIQLVAVKS